MGQSCKNRFLQNTAMLVEKPTISKIQQADILTKKAGIVGNSAPNRPVCINSH